MVSVIYHMKENFLLYKNNCKLWPSHDWTHSLTLCLPHSPICTSVNVPRSPICTVIHTPMVHSYCSMKRLPLFLVRTVCMRYQYAFLEFSIQFTGKKIQRVEHSTSKCHPNSSVPQNNVAHGGFVHGKQRVKQWQGRESKIAKLHQNTAINEKTLSTERRACQKNQSCCLSFCNLSPPSPLPQNHRGPLLVPHHLNPPILWKMYTT